MTTLSAANADRLSSPEVIADPYRIEALTPWIQSVADELLDEMGSSGEHDVITSYAIPLPVKVIARLLGIPGEDYVTLKRWSDAFLAFSSMAPEERARSNARWRHTSEGWPPQGAPMGQKTSLQHW